MFLRTLVGLTNFSTIDFSHWETIRYEKSLKENNDNKYIHPYYNKVMSRFWADKVLSGPFIKKISIRLRRKENVGYRPTIVDNFKNVHFDTIISYLINYLSLCASGYSCPCSLRD